ncbi:hypothetical protein [Acetobacterium malicum]|uniref:hypothetical protein n=1 Tax=Acetobacterium malicum TaxID=52692 RepID=UPI003594495E
MKKKVIQLFKNSDGNALPFVIIIGVVLMLLVVSMMTAAIGGINFTQISLESRQAYIDAKSVTEYGRVLIDKKIAESKSVLLSDRDSTNTTGEILYYINGMRPSPTEPMVFSESSSLTGTTIGVVKLKWDKTNITGDVDHKIATTEYTAFVETQGLRRKLNYELPFTYVVETKKTGTTPDVPDEPTVSPSTENTEILIGHKGLECFIQGDGIGQKYEKDNILEVVPNNNNFSKLNVNITRFEFLQSKKLVLASNQVVISAPMPNVYNPSYTIGQKTGDTFDTKLISFKSGYTPDNGGGSSSDNRLRAKEITINGDVNLGYGSTLDIECDNLFITGNINLSTQTAVNKIKAKNIVINGNLYLSHATKLMIDCPNVWLGSLTSGATTPELEVKNVKYFKAGAMNVNDKMKLTIVGASGNENNQVEVGSLEGTSNGQKISISGIYLFNCLGNFTQKCSEGGFVSIQSKVIKIAGDLTLSEIGDANSKFLTNYFICGGNTSFNLMTGGFFIGDSGIATSCIKFAGAYRQVESQIKLYGNQIISFNGNVQLGTSGANRSFRLELKSDNIYFQGSQVVTNSGEYQPNRIICAGFSNPQSAKVYLKNGASSPAVAAGKYIGYSTNELSDKTLVPGDFSLILFPDPPVADGGTTGGGTGGGTGGSGGTGGGGTDEEVIVTVTPKNEMQIYY